MTIGFPQESPRWFNYGGFNQDIKELTIKSTQTHLGFKIPTDFNRVEVREFWKQFREYRTNFLIDNYPSIEAY